jgi:hypothetical protein
LLLCVYTTHWLTSSFWNANTTIRYCIHCLTSYLPRRAWTISHISFNCAINFVFTCCISHFQGWGLCLVDIIIVDPICANLFISNKFQRYCKYKKRITKANNNKETNSYPLIIIFLGCLHKKASNFL